MPEQQKTLVILSPGFPKDEADTTCLPTQQLFVKSLQAQYPDLKIVVLAFRYPFVKATYEWHGIEIISLNNRRKGFINHLALWLHIWQLFRRLKTQHNIIGLLSFWCTEYAMVAKYFAIRNRLKHFIWLKGQDARAGNQFVRLIKPKGDELIAISDFVVDEFYRNYKVRPLHIVPNAIDESLFIGEQTERDIDILGVGSLIPLKQYDVFIEVVKDIKAKIPDISTVICGKGPEADNLKEAIRNQLLDNHIAIIGEQPHNEVLKLMQRSKILLHPSSYEGFSTVCLEALYAGMHVTSFHKPMKENIKNWHVVKDKNEMAEKAITLLLDPDTKFERVRVYAMEDTVNAVMNLFYK